MRAALVFALALSLPVVGAAQSRVAQPRISGSLPSIGLPLPSITPPLAPIGLPRTVGAPRHALPAPGIPHPGRGSVKRPLRPTSVVYFFPYVWGGMYGRAVEPEKPRRPDRDARRHSERTASGHQGAAATGTLRLDVEPAGLLQVYVDGLFVGTPADFAGELQLEEGAHQVELRAPGYRTLSFGVRIAAGRSTSYRASLEPLVAPASDAAPPPPVESLAAAAPKTTIYLISGCYLGNVPPDPARLPASCDTTKVTTFEP